MEKIMFELKFNFCLNWNLNGLFLYFDVLLKKKKKKIGGKKLLTYPV